LASIRLSSAVRVGDDGEADAVLVGAVSGQFVVASAAGLAGTDEGLVDEEDAHGVSGQWSVVGGQ